MYCLSEGQTELVLNEPKNKRHIYDLVKKV
jgi:hypothetical protein